MHFADAFWRHSSFSTSSPFAFWRNWSCKCADAFSLAKCSNAFAALFLPRTFAVSSSAFFLLLSSSRSRTKWFTSSLSSSRPRTDLLWLTSSAFALCRVLHVSVKSGGLAGGLASVLAVFNNNSSLPSGAPNNTATMTPGVFWGFCVSTTLNAFESFDIMLVESRNSVAASTVITPLMSPGSKGTRIDT